jgi:hypothetical protein
MREVTNRKSADGLKAIGAQQMFCCYAATFLRAGFLRGSRRPITTIPAQTTTKAMIGSSMMVVSFPIL